MGLMVMMCGQTGTGHHTDLPVFCQLEVVEGWGVEEEVRGWRGPGTRG
jgi:hypothetical protein